MLQTIFFIIMVSFIYLVGIVMIAALIIFAIHDIRHTIWMEKRGYKTKRRHYVL